MTKAQLRKKYKSLRNTLTPKVIDNYSLAIANQVLKLDIWQHKFYHIFLSIESQKEVNTDYILNILSGKDKNIIISKSNFTTNTLENYLLTDTTTLKLNEYNIPEPIDGIKIDNSLIDVVFIPLLAYDLNGNRVGYGKGFYDRFLNQCRPDTIKIGLSFFDPEIIIDDFTPDDVSLDFCINCKNNLSFL